MRYVLNYYVISEAFITYLRHVLNYRFDMPWEIFIIDNEPPKVISCPQNIEKTATSKTQVIWTEPVFDDNVEGRGVDRDSSLKNGQQFGEGQHNVRYTAADKAGNKAVCEFKLIIRSEFIEF